jgi:hypothetical protein
MTHTQAMDLSAVLLKAPRECWIALTEDGTRLLGWGETMADAAEKARAAGVEEPLLYWTPEEAISRVLRESGI